MVIKRIAVFLFVLLVFATGGYAQQPADTLVNRRIDTLHKLIIDFKDQVLLFNAGLKKDSSGVKGANNLTISGYVDVYYGFYTDSTQVGGYEKFPTSAPRSDAFGLNIAQLSAKYSAEKLRGVLTLQYGDIPRSAWSNEFNMIQEANVGIALGRRVWVDAGFFRTHLGCESIQPRENINIGMAITTYYEPYYLSGAKLSYYVTNKLMLQACVFNGFNTFVPTNKKKAFCFSATYEFNPKLSAYYNLLVSDESPDHSPVAKTRFYNDFFMIYKSKKVDAALELNLGVQDHSRLSDSSKPAVMYSGNLIVKHKLTGRLAWYGRYELYEDTHEMLTGPVYNQYHNIVGINAMGYTLGFEVKPYDNVYFRTEGRYLHMTDNEKIFRYNNRYTNERYEVLASMGVWF